MTTLDLITANKTKNYFPPFAAGDPGLLINLYPVITAANAAAAGFAALGGSPAGTFDATRGYKPGTADGLKNTTTLATVTPKTFTIVMEVDRTALAVDNVASSTIFYNSIGDAVRTNEGYLFTLGQASPLDIVRLKAWRVGVSLGGMNIFRNSTQTNGASQSFTSYGNNLYDKDYAQVVWTINGTRWWLYLDGIVLDTGTVNSEFVSGSFGTITLGYYHFSNSFFLGNHWIRSLQVSTRYVQPNCNGPKTGVIGDSFTLRGYNSTQSGADTVAGVNTANAGAFTPHSLYAKTQWTNGQSGWLMQLQGMALKKYGMYLPMYVSSYAGKGWAQDVVPIPAAYFTAVAKSGAEILIAFGSVNDVNSGVPAQLVTDIKASLASVVDNSPTLRHILFFETFAWAGGNTSAVGGRGTPAGWMTEYRRQIALMRAGLPNVYVGSGARATNFPAKGLPNTIPITYVKTDELWRENSSFLRFITATNPDNVSNTKDNGSGPDSHPCCEGSIQQANIIWPWLENCINCRPNRT